MGADSCSSHEHNIVTQMLEGHIRALRRHPVYSNSIFYFFIESNYGGWWGSDIISKIANQDEFQPVVLVSYDPQGKDRIGIWMVPEVKKACIESMSRTLADGHAVFAKDFVTHYDPRTETIEKAKARIQDTIREQMIFYREELRQPVDATGVVKRFQTGKDAGRKDDLLMCLMIAKYFSEKKKLETPFREKVAMHNWRV